MKKAFLLFLAAIVIAASVFAIALVRSRRAFDERESDCWAAHVAALVTIKYVSAHHGQLPFAQNWEDSFGPFLPRQLRASITVAISDGPGNTPRRLAMNRQLSGVNIAKIVNISNTVLYYAVNSSNKNASGTPPRDILDPRLTNRGPIYDCLDGHTSN